LSNSLTFCQNRASNPSISFYADRNWSNAAEHDITPPLDHIVKGDRKYELTGKFDDDTDLFYNVNINIDPDAEFDYFVSDSFISDGTLIFLVESMDKLIKKAMSLQTYNKELGPPPNGCTVNLTLGNFVVLNEYDGDWIPADKKWMRERTTVLLPIKMEYDK